MRAINRKRRLRQQSGQAGLISLLVVMLIIGVLAEVYYPRISGRNEYAPNGQVKGAATPIDRANDTACTVYMEQVGQAAFLYRQDHGTPPPDLEALKPYGVDRQIIDTPDCNFGIPKTAPPAQQPDASFGAASSVQPPAQPAPQAPGPTAPAGSIEVGGIRVPTTAAGNDLGSPSGQ